MSIFDINFDKWIATMLPTFLRKRRVYAFCRSLCSPVVTLYKQFLNVRGDHIYALSHNGQVCYLRAALNDAFGTTGFEIADVDDHRGEWQFAKEPSMENQLTAVDEKKNPHDGSPPESPVPILADEVRLNAPMNSFIVYVPGNIYNSQSQLDKVKAIVEQYRLLSKTPIYTPTTSTNEQGSIFIDSNRHRWEWPVSVIDTRVELYTGSSSPLAGNGANSR